MNTVTLLLVSSLLPYILANERTCSKYICRNSTSDNSETFYGYFGGEVAENALLNITDVLQNTTASNKTTCVKRCMHTDECYSINASPEVTVYDGSVVNVSVECHLLRENFYSNNTLVIARSGWTHISVKNTGCERKLCMNNGTCVPNYKDDTFTCECPIEYWGEYCERRRPFAEGGTADVEAYCHYPFVHNSVTYMDCTDIATPDNTATGSRWCGTTADTSKWGFCTYQRGLPDWNFNFNDGETTNTGIKKDTMTFGKSSGIIVSVPDRKGKVLYCDGTLCVDSETESSNPEVNAFRDPESCADGISLSIWIKIQHGEWERMKTEVAFPSSIVFYKLYRGTNLWYDNKEQKWVFNIVTSASDIKNEMNETRPQAWHHLGLTFDGSEMQAYYDGEQILTNATITAVTDNQNQEIHFFKHDGHSDVSKHGRMFIDDFKFWVRAVSTETMKQIYLNEQVW